MHIEYDNVSRTAYHKDFLIGNTCISRNQNIIKMHQIASEQVNISRVNFVWNSRSLVLFSNCKGCEEKHFFFKKMYS